MKKLVFGILVFVFICTSFAKITKEEELKLYPIPEESKKKDGVKYGETIKAQFSDSKIFPGTNRSITVYVPSEYDGKTPVCMIIFQDKLNYEVETLISNMISKKEIPMMVAIGVSQGFAKGDFSKAPRLNRSFEYDSFTPRYANFLLNEVLPFVETLKTSDGRAIKLSKKGSDRMIAGGSSGAAAAFTAGWFYPEEFPRVYSSIGSYTGLRGNYAYSTLLHKFEPKALRLFLQSGKNDMWTPFGDWWSANNAMIRALSFAGYDGMYRYELGEGGHTPYHSTHIFPEVMKFMWGDYPAKIDRPISGRNNIFKNIFTNGDGFKEYKKVDRKTSITTDEKGDVIINKAGEDRILAVSNDSSKLIFSKNKELLIKSRDGKVKKVSDKIYPKNGVGLSSGNFYVVGGKSENENPTYLWLIDKEGKSTQLDSLINGAYALSLSPEGDWLNIFEFYTKRGYVYKINAIDNKTEYKQEFFSLMQPDNYDFTEVTSAITDKGNRVYLATTFGIQICDHTGRTIAIVPMPENAKPLSLAFGGGKKQNELYVLCDNGVIYKRLLKNTSLK